MSRDIKIRYNKNEKLITPNGYMRIGKGRKIKAGDRYLSKNSGYWLKTKMLPDAIIDIGTYIRKIKVSKTQKEKTKEKRIKFVAKELKNRFANQIDDYKKLASLVIDIVNLSNREITH
jgi:hypothetical protein